ncbi:hypothetical protein ZWY2020_016388 [Hordeum vulgare]|nr:hypothetical protein ZWY2020_016388 [Hordeum vulgare]
MAMAACRPPPRRRRAQPGRGRVPPRPRRPVACSSRSRAATAASATAPPSSISLPPPRRATRPSTSSRRTPSPSSSGTPATAGRLRRRRGAGGGGGGPALVVLLGWLGARQKHLRRYADLYRDRGVGSVRFVVPVRELLGLDLGRRVERRVADLSAEIAAWCDADRSRKLLFHTFSNTGWLAYGAVLENLQSRADIIERIKGVWAAGFSAAMLKKSSSLTGPLADSPDGSTLNGALNKVTSVSELTKPSWSETFLLSTLQKFLRRMHKVLSVLSDKQPCPSSTCTAPTE